MNSSAAIAVLGRSGAAFAGLLTPANLSAPVLGCPGWNVADLARHLGGVHRWARHAVLYGPSEPPEGPAEAAAVRPWYEEGLAELTETLQESSPEMPCWTLAAPTTARFWMRRQAHETALHHWDAATSLGQSATLAEPLAVDGIDEVVKMFLPRQVRLHRLALGPETVRIVCESGPAFTVTTTQLAPPSQPDATVTGSAEALLLLLWKRIDISDARLQVAGSVRAATTLLAKPLTP